MEVVSDDKGAGKFFTFFVDDKEFRTEKSHLTGGEIMDIAGIPRSTGIVQILDDNSQKQIGENEIIEFEGPGRRLKKAPRFRRG